MTHKIKQRFLSPNLEIDGAKALDQLDFTAATGASIERKFGVLRVAEITLSSFVVSMTAANDFGGTKICDLPNTNLLVMGVMVDLAVTVAGLATNTAASLDVAIGTVTTASVDFSNAGEDNLVAKIDGVGATATGTVEGHSGALTSVLVTAGASNALYLNASSPVTTGTGTATFSGTIRVFYFDLSVAS